MFELTDESELRLETAIASPGATAVALDGERIALSGKSGDYSRVELYQRFGDAWLLVGEVRASLFGRPVRSLGASLALSGDVLVAEAARPLDTSPPPPIASQAGLRTSSSGLVTASGCSSRC